MAPAVGLGAALPAEAQAAAERALAQLGESGEACERTVAQIVKVLSDVVREPDNLRYRRLRLSNTRVAALLGVPGATELLQAAGFAVVHHPPEAQPQAQPEPFLELPLGAGDAPRCAAVARLAEDWLALRRQMQAAMARELPGHKIR